MSQRRIALQRRLEVLAPNVPNRSSEVLALLRQRKELYTIFSETNSHRPCYEERIYLFLPPIPVEANEREEKLKVVKNEFFFSFFE